MAMSSRAETSRISSPVCSIAPIAPAATASRGALANTVTVP